MDNLTSDIRKLIFDSPLADTHEHLVEESDRLEGGSHADRRDIGILFTQYVDSCLIVAGMSEDDVARKLKLMETKGVVDDAAFNKLDPDARTVLLKEEVITEEDVLAEARTLTYRVTKQGDEELLRAIATGDLRGANFAGEVNGDIQRQVLKQL